MVKRLGKIESLKLGSCNQKSLAANCPVCGASCLPYEVNVEGFDSVFCRYECRGEPPCEVCKGKGQIVVGVGSPGDEQMGGTKVEECDECGGRGYQECNTHYAADGERSSWID